MTVLRRRDKVLIFRLTQEEYASLLEACEERGGRNLSDFARTELLSVIDNTQSGRGVELRLSTVERQLSDVQSDVQRMTQLLEQMAARPGRKARA